MNYKCSCTLKDQATGDGCHICNTEYLIDHLPQPVELADELKANAGFTDDQAETIASEIYQPLCGLISTLNEKIEQIRLAV